MESIDDELITESGDENCDGFLNESINDNFDGFEVAENLRLWTGAMDMRWTRAMDLDIR